MRRGARHALRSLTVLLAAGCAAGERAGGGVEIGAPAPAYQAVALGGAPVSLAERRGTVVLLNIWATWCRPCRTEIPVLQQLHERYAARGFEVIGVSVDARGEEAAVREFGRQYGITYPIWLDPDERVATTFVAIGVPATYLIGRDGTLLWRHLGPIEPDDPELAKTIEAAVGG